MICAFIRVNCLVQYKSLFHEHNKIGAFRYEHTQGQAQIIYNTLKDSIRGQIGILKPLGSYVLLALMRKSHISRVSCEKGPIGHA